MVGFNDQTHGCWCYGLLKKNHHIKICLSWCKHCEQMDICGSCKLKSPSSFNGRIVKTKGKNLSMKPLDLPKSQPFGDDHQLISPIFYPKKPQMSIIKKKLSTHISNI